MSPFMPALLFVPALLYCCCQPKSSHPPGETLLPAVQENNAAAQPDNELPAADGSLDSLLQILYGDCHPAVDTTFRWPADIVWDDREINGKWYSRFSGHAAGFSLKIEEVRDFDPRPRGIGRDESERTTIDINGRKFRLNELFFTNTRDTVDDVWDFSPDWQKITLKHNTFFYNDFGVPGCVGSGCLWACTAVVDLNGPQPGFYLFERSGINTGFKDIDCDGKLELVDAVLGPEEHPYFSDTVHLSLHPYEWTPGAGFNRMLDAKGKPCFAEIFMVNGIFEPRQARILRKNWPR